MAQLVQQIGGHQWNVREMVLNAGIGQYLAQMAIPYMYFLPRTCDPYAQGTQAIVQGLQNMLAARGHHVPVDGWMGKATMDALRIYAGPRWMDKNWVQLYGDVMAGKVVARGPRAALPPAGRPQDLGSSLIGDVVFSPLGIVAMAAGAWIFMTRRSNLRRRRAEDDYRAETARRRHVAWQDAMIRNRLDPLASAASPARSESSPAQRRKRSRRRRSRR